MYLLLFVVFNQVPQGQVIRCIVLYSAVLMSLLPVIISPFSTALSGTRGACVPCQTLMKHDLATTCEIFYIELPLQGCEVRRGVHQGSKVKCLNTWEKLI